MLKFTIKLCVASTLLLTLACNNTAKTEATNTATPTTTPTTTEPTSRTVAAPEKGDYCFVNADGKDSTTVKIRVLSTDDIRGEMIWNPYQKDGAIGTLTGKCNANNEMELLYNYKIEGNKQTEAKVMKIENGLLLIKKGELVDAKNDGNSVMKDAAKAIYADTLTKINCQ